jgi:hypothetical protein
VIVLYVQWVERWLFYMFSELRGDCFICSVRWEVIVLYVQWVERWLFVFVDIGKKKLTSRFKLSFPHHLMKQNFLKLHKNCFTRISDIKFVTKTQWLHIYIRSSNNGSKRCICHGRWSVLCSNIWGERWLFCWYWLNCWLSLLKVSFHN